MKQFTQLYPVAKLMKHDRLISIFVERIANYSLHFTIAGNFWSARGISINDCVSIKESTEMLDFLKISHVRSYIMWQWTSIPKSSSSCKRFVFYSQTFFVQFVLSKFLKVQSHFHIFNLQLKLLSIIGFPI